MVLHLTLPAASDLRNVFAAITSAMAEARENTISDAAESLVGYIRDEKLSGSPIHRRSGELINSLSARLQYDAVTTTATVGSSVRYAPILEFGGTLASHAAAHLTIPLAAVLAGGSSDARQLIADPSSGGFTGVFARDNILFGTLPERDIVPLFKLQPTVTIPARPFMSSALAEKRDDIMLALGTAIEQVL